MSPRNLLIVAGALLVSACDLGVTNPGPVQAQFLNDPAALPAVVNGAGRDLAEALNWTTYTAAAAAREIWPAGSTGSFGISVSVQNGLLIEEESTDFWDRAHRARWTAEQGAVRIRNVLGDVEYNRSLLAARILVWGGFANRMLGENMCNSVIDGGASGAPSVHFVRAESLFTAAIAIATAAAGTVGDSLVRAATAGRASVRLNLGNTAGAATDAATIPNAFTYKMPYFGNDQVLYNRISFANANQPYRAHTQKYTWVEAYRRATNDSRVPYDSSATQANGDGAVSNQPGGGSGAVRWYFQRKFSANTTGINMASGWEMRLLEAEVLLIGGDVTGAVNAINVRRASVSVPAVALGTAAEAWTSLKRERAIELWLEARRLGDIRRWEANSRPGSYNPLEGVAGRDRCFPISREERASNPNLAP